MEFLYVLLGAVISLGAVFCGHTITLGALKPRPDKVEKEERNLGTSRYAITRTKAEEQYVPWGKDAGQIPGPDIPAPTTTAAPVGTPVQVRQAAPAARAAGIPVQVSQAGTPIDRRGR